VNLRKIIKETIEQMVDKSEVAEKFDQDIIYLKGFSLNKKEIKGDFTIWIFEHKSKDYRIRFYIQKNNSQKKWFCKIFIYWKTPSKEFTNAKGKDFDHTFGPYDSYEDMILELNRKLKNNPLISKENFIDDDNTQFNKDVVEMLKQMMDNSEKLNTVKDVHFKDIKKIYNDVKNINSLEELQNYINKKAPNEEDKQSLLLTLQKIYQLNFYINKEKIDSLF